MKKKLLFVPIVAIAVIGGYAWLASRQEIAEPASSSGAGVPAKAASGTLAVQPDSRLPYLPRASVEGLAPRGPHTTAKLPSLPPGPLAGYLPDLIAKASASPPSHEAALRAYYALNACNFQDSTLGANVPPESRVDCAGITPEQKAQAFQWMKLAAELGNEKAMIDYGRSGPILEKSGADIIKNPEELIEFKADSQRFLQGAADNGNVEAMWFMADAYQRGTYGDTDPVLALAYGRAMEMTGRATGPMILTVRQLESSMSPEQQQHGRSLAVQIHARCCAR